jgi:hypothetical protein
MVFMHVANWDVEWLRGSQVLATPEFGKHQPCEDANLFRVLAEISCLR